MASSIRAVWNKCSVCVHGEAAGVRMNAFTLQFLDRGLEEGFSLARKCQLIAKSRFGALVVAVTCAVSLMMNMTFTPAGAEEAEVRAFTHNVVVALLCFALSMVVVSCAIPRVAARISPTAVECIVVLCILAFLVAFTLALPWQAAYTTGYDPNVIFSNGYDSVAESHHVLVIDVIITVAFLLLPVRFRSLLIVPPVGVMVYVVPAFVPGGPEKQGAPFSTLMLVVLSGMAAVGKRSLELQERTLFSTVLREKTLRFESEFELSKMGQASVLNVISEKDSVTGSWRESHPESLPSTTNTERLFSEKIGSAEGAQLSQQLRQVGEKEQWLISRADVALEQGATLGEGGFGRVILGQYQGLSVAVKVPKERHDVSSKSRVLQLCNELRILRRIRHPHIVSFYGACIDAERGRVFLILELIRGSPLGDFIRARQDPPSELVRACMLTGVSAALRYLHSRTPVVLHGDLKDSNVFVLHCCARTPPSAKLLDFGLSRVLTKRAEPLGGTLRWAAPEVLRSQPPSAAADVFSFGRLVFFVATGRYPWSQVKGDRIRSMALEREPPQALDWPAAGGWLAEHCRPVVAECCMVEPPERPDMVQLQLQTARWLEELTLRASPKVCDCSAPREEANAPRAEEPGSAAPGPRRACSVGGACGGPLPRKLHQGCEQNSSLAQQVLGVPALAPLPKEVVPLPEEALASSAGCRRGGSGESLVYPGLLPTQQETIRMLVMEAMLQCNVPKPSGSCCEFHAYMLKLDEVCRELKTSGCKDVRASVRAQCQECFRLNFDYGSDSPADDKICDFCGGETVPHEQS